MARPRPEPQPLQDFRYPAPPNPPEPKKKFPWSWLFFESPFGWISVVVLIFSAFMIQDCHERRTEELEKKQWCCAQPRDWCGDAKKTRTECVQWNASGKTCIRMDVKPDCAQLCDSWVRTPAVSGSACPVSSAEVPR